jgi:hypothetical protein
VTRRPGLVYLLQFLLLLEASAGLLPLTYGMAARAAFTGQTAGFSRTGGGFFVVLGAGVIGVLGWAAIGVGTRRRAAGGVAIMVNGLIVIAAVMARFASWWAIAAGTLGLVCLVILSRPPVRAWIYEDDRTGE